MCGRRGGPATAVKCTNDSSSSYHIDARTPTAEAISELSWEWRLEPAAATGLVRSCLFSVLEEPEGKAHHKSITFLSFIPLPTSGASRTGTEHLLALPDNCDV